MRHYDQFVFSPGFSHTHPWRRLLENHGSVYGELGFAAQRWKGKIIGVTGTNGPKGPTGPKHPRGPRGPKGPKVLWAHLGPLSHGAYSGPFGPWGPFRAVWALGPIRGPLGPGAHLGLFGPWGPFGTLWAHLIGVALLEKGKGLKYRALGLRPFPSLLQKKTKT